MKNKAGMTLAEIILSIALIGIVIAGLSPAFLLSTKEIVSARNSMTAVNIANQAMEDIRAMPFSEVGLVGGTPEGNIAPERTVTENRCTFNVKTEISWLENEVCKTVKVTVESSGGIPVEKEYSTMITREPLP